MKRMKVLFGLSIVLFSSPAISMAAQEQLSRNEMGFIDETNNIPTPPMYPMPSSMDEHESVQILGEYITALAKGLGDLENHLERNSKMARATWVVSELKHMKGKDCLGIEFLCSLLSLSKVCSPKSNPSFAQGVTFKEHGGKLGV